MSATDLSAVLADVVWVAPFPASGRGLQAAAMCLALDTPQPEPRPVTFASFTQDVERLIDDPFAIAGRLKPLLATDGWLAPEHQLGGRDAFRRHVLHISDCRRLSVEALVCLPGQQTPIHDHAAWCVAGVYRGIQRQLHFSLIERNWKPCLVPTGTFEAPAGHVDVFAPPAENIHSVTAVGEGKTISIHVYGDDIERLSWRRYDDIPQFVPGPDRRFPDA